ncbi:hypothetical protein A3G56_03045 [Candidatus Falkowbacteria bacterium RIFCSPLOWO2_12_FULL_45_10]|uniref:DUF3566 domain-containing protein n=3 Tax=Candidatus Falkowiibacteriota TaxID=1752728 RepID=A0A1F5RVS0_9BACT|nr:MAG: hypothetical protein A3D54_02745 [Candidatus Falkowbacteria bacterium RIFCSPHIGHO2_02_FULL_45_15]OGF18714.1 MAG: hypothetical protein A3G56_03045 [Candidatus Falkowbacteria bacterium RIFCSPLOWO2_12_FULL_45_10]OGF18852.1 MAG: hypothetical protein A3I35_01340 [Candidatus Falkowbacteria bacterium RIFCSPLOWO2_02_FULL_45_15]
MQTITKFNPKSVANIYGFFLALSAFLTGLGISIVNIVNRLLAGGNTFASALLAILFNLLYGVLIGLISALAAAVIGYLSGWIFAWLYNLCVRIKFIGGVKVELE